MNKSLDHLEIGEIEVFIDIFLSPFNFANEWLKHMSNQAASQMPLARCARSLASLE